MSKDKFSFGRKSKCDFTFLEVDHQIRKELYFQISYHHFTIHRCLDSVFLEDHSSNGTYVNGARVVSDGPNGKRQVLLQNEDKISVAHPKGPSKAAYICVCFKPVIFNF